MLTLAGVCVAVVVVAVVARAAAGWAGHRGARGAAIALSAVGPLAPLVWLPSGPLARGWARRAGTRHICWPALGAPRSRNHRQARLRNQRQAAHPRPSLRRGAAL